MCSSDLIEDRVVAVGDDGLASLFELLQVVDDQTAEEGRPIVQRGLVDDDLRALGFDPLHDALNGTLAEVVAVALHREAVDANSWNGLLLHTPHPFGELPYFRGAAIILVVFGVGVVASHLQDLVGDEVLPRPVALDDGRHHVLRHVLVVGQQLLGVLGEAVSAVAEAGVVVMGADSRVQSDAVDDSLGVQTTASASCMPMNRTGMFFSNSNF